MKLHSWLLITHSSVAAFATFTCLVLASLSLPTWTFLCAAIAAMVAALASAAFITNRVNRGLRELERIASKASNGGCQSFPEFNSVGARLGEFTSRWREAAATGLEQHREVETLFRQLDRRVAPRGDGSTGMQLRQVLRAIGDNLGDQLTKIAQLSSEIQQYNNNIVQGNEEQAEWIAKTTASVERISGNIDAVSNAAESTKSAADQLHVLVNGAAESIKLSVAKLECIDLAADASERKIRNLDDHSSKVLSIVETLGALASRTDLLALNASIESVRAGEHGRGFAIVAEEIRELAEQSAQATREVAGLVGSMRAETRETMNLLTQERADIASSDRRVSQTLKAMHDASELFTQWVGQAEGIAVVTRQQLNIVQDIVVTVERLSHTAKTNRNLAERANWNSDALRKSMELLERAVDPLRGRGGETIRSEDQTEAVEQTFNSVNDSIHDLRNASTCLEQSSQV